MADEQTIKLARTLMRRGLSDETIELQTGLCLTRILDLRVEAALAEPTPPEPGRAQRLRPRPAS